MVGWLVGEAVGGKLFGWPSETGLPSFKKDNAGQ